MGVVVRVLIAVSVVACGRLDFSSSAAGDAGGDGAVDAGIDPHLVAWYTFDAGLGTRSARDATGHGHEAECPDTFACPSTTAGHSGLAIAGCSPTAPGLQSDDSPALRLAAPFSLAAWVSWNDTAGLSSIIAKPVGATTFDSYQLDVDAAGIVRFTIGDASTFARLPSAAPLALGAWTHVAATYDGATMQLYVGGTAAAAPIAGHAIAYDTQSLLLGVDRNAGAYAEEFEGSIDDVRIYDIALASADVAALASM